MNAVPGIALILSLHWYLAIYVLSKEQAIPPELAADSVSSKNSGRDELKSKTDGKPSRPTTTTEDPFNPKLPIISMISAERNQRVGSSAELECKYRNNENGLYPVRWAKMVSDKGNPHVKVPKVLALNSNLITRDPRITVILGKANTTSFIRIKNLKLDDAATYQCAILISEKYTAKADIDLEVLP